MATYTPRGDGLVNVDVGGGRMLAMPEAHAQAGGATLAMPNLAPPPGLNPYSALGPNAVAGPGGGGSDEQAIAAAMAAPQAPAPQQPSPFVNGQLNIAPGTRLEAPPMPDGRPRPDFAAGVQQLQAEAPQANPEAAAAPVEGLTRIDPRSGIPQGPPGVGYGAAGPGRVVQTSKGGDMRASFVRKPGEELAPGVAEYASSLDPAAVTSSRETAVTNAAIARDNGVAAEIDGIRAAEGELEAQRAKVAENRAALQQKLDIVDQREREAMNATPQTRREVLQSRGALAGVMSGLSIALGGWVQGLRGGENPGLKIINDSIESEISSQRAKWEAQKDKVGMARSDFGQAMQLYGDPNMAEADMRMRALTLAANMANTYKAQGDNQEWLANQQQVTQQLASQAAGEKQKWKTLADGQVVQENYVYKPPTFAQVGGPAKVTKEQREIAKDARERLIRAPDGSYAYVGSPNRVKEVQEQLTAGGDVVDGMAKLLTLANDNTITDLEKRAKYKALTQDIRPIISVAKKQGAMGEQEVKGYEDLLGDPSAIIRDNGATIKMAIEQQRARNNRVLRDNAFADPDATIPFAAAPASTFKPGLK